MKILGISAFYHDSAAALVVDGEVMAASQEERHSRIKYDENFPTKSIEHCLTYSGLKLADIDAIVFYEKPFLTFERILEISLATAPKGFSQFALAMPVWLTKKLNMRKHLRNEFKKHFKFDVSEKIFFSTHHLSHASSAFYPSPYSEAAILCMDGVGESTTTSAWVGRGHHIKPLWRISYPHSLGMLYSAFTYFCGFKVNSGEYKLMGLAPYGEPLYKKVILENLVDLKEDGSFRLNLKYFDYVSGLNMTNQKFQKLLQVRPRKPEERILKEHCDLAASIQAVCEEIVLKLARHLKQQTGLSNLCLAGGVALNCVANGKIHDEKIFENIWVQPASGDAGGALGAALAYYYSKAGAREFISKSDGMKGSLLGASYSDEQIKEVLDRHQIQYQEFSLEDLLPRVAKNLHDGQVVGWFQGRSEFGPRALGSRSILGAATSSEMQSKMNLKIKYRESFRPFAPIVLSEDAQKYFSLNQESPYMLLVARVKDATTIDKKELDHSSLTTFLGKKRSSITAVTHVDGSARVQTVDPERNQLLHNLLNEYRKVSGHSVLMNTSFNVRGEPIVESPFDALRCFMTTEMDSLVMGSYLILKIENTFNSSKKWSSQVAAD